MKRIVDATICFECEDEKLSFYESSFLVETFLIGHIPGVEIFTDAKQNRVVVKMLMPKVK